LVLPGVSKDAKDPERGLSSLRGTSHAMLPLWAGMGAAGGAGAMAGGGGGGAPPGGGIGGGGGGGGSSSNESSENRSSESTCKIHHIRMLITSNTAVKVRP